MPVELKHKKELLLYINRLITSKQLEDEIILKNMSDHLDKIRKEYQLDNLESIDSNYLRIYSTLTRFGIHSCGSNYNIELNTPLAHKDIIIDSIRKEVDSLQYELKRTCSSEQFYRDNTLSKSKYLFNINDLEEKFLKGFNLRKLKYTDDCFYMVNFNLLRNNRYNTLRYKYIKYPLNMANALLSYVAESNRLPVISFDLDNFIFI